MSAATNMMTLTPSTTPKTVSALRSLCVRRVPMACLRFSPFACGIAAPLTVRSQGFNGIKLRGAHRRENPEEKSNTRGNHQRKHHRADRRLHGHGDERLGEINDKVRTKDSDQPARGRKHGGLSQKLHENMFLARAERTAQTDLSRALGDARQHDVHDNDATD